MAETQDTSTDHQDLYENAQIRLAYARDLAQYVACVEAQPEEDNVEIARPIVAGVCGAIETLIEDARERLERVQRHRLAEDVEAEA